MTFGGKIKLSNIEWLCSQFKTIVKLWSKEFLRSENVSDVSFWLDRTARRCCLNGSRAQVYSFFISSCFFTISRSVALSACLWGHQKHSPSSSFSSHIDIMSIHLSIFNQKLVLFYLNYFIHLIILRYFMREKIFRIQPIIKKMIDSSTIIDHV